MGVLIADVVELYLLFIIGFGLVLIGQTIHLIGPTSAPLWVLIELIRTDLGKLQRFTLRWIILSAAVMIAIAILTGAISF